MSFSEKDDTLMKMTDKMAALETALKQIADAKKQLCRNTTEAKSRIQCNISRQLEALRNREVWLLNQLDVVSSAKEEVLQQQSARLNKTLGVIQSSLQFPANTGDNSMTRNLARLDLGELQPEETPYVSFKCSAGDLRDAIMSYGRIDHNSVPPLHSPFMSQHQLAPSLPKHFEDYNDAEHHVLYKTVEEINRNKTSESCVTVNIPKLSNRVEDWLLYPTSTSASHTTDPKFTFPTLSNNLSDWLKTSATTSKPVAMVTTVQSQRVGQNAAGPNAATHANQCMGQEPAVPLCNMGGFEDMSADASIKTWLHKIKQNPFEEDEYDFVEEMSETQTHCSVDTMESPGLEAWLSASQTDQDATTKPATMFQMPSLPMSEWLLDVKCKPDSSTPAWVDMTRYLKNITDELHLWLLKRDDVPDTRVEDSKHERLRPDVPSSLTLRSLSNQLSTSDNPWLHKPSLLNQSRKASSVSSGGSSFSSAQLSSHNKWLLHGGQTQVTPSSTIACSFMERYQSEMDKLNWVKCDVTNKAASNKNPLANFVQESCESTRWLKPSSLPTSAPMSDTLSPLKNYLDLQKNSPNTSWLLRSVNSTAENPVIDDNMCNNVDKMWLVRASSPFLSEEAREMEV